MSTQDTSTRARRRAYAAIITTVLIALILMIRTEDKDIDEAVAAIGAAFIGVAGTALGHAVGFHHERSTAHGPSTAVEDPMSKRRYVAEAVAIIVVALVFPAVALLLGDIPRLSAEAAAALLGALAGITATDMAHKRSLSRSDQWWLGRSLIGGGVLSGVLLALFPHQANVITAIATTAIPVGGAVLGFAHGRRTAKAVRDDAAQSSARSAAHNSD
jgi:hypothetical protein